MKSPIRERGYIEVTFGVVNHKAQEKARVNENGNFAYYTNNNRIFDSQVRKEQYGTFEENFTRLDREMYFPPRPDSGLGYYDTGLVGGSLVSDGYYEVTINLNIPNAEIKGLTIDFGDNYPTDFDIHYSSGAIPVFGNTEKKWVTETVIGPTDYIRIVARAMKNTHSRLRISSILFGYGLVYDNESVMDSRLESFVSPTCQELPQIDFSVTLNNYDQYFNVDDPESAINFLETGQEMNVRYGYQLPKENEEDEDEIEWIQGAKLLCSEWEATDTTATIRAWDVFRSMDSEYYKGVYNANGRSFYNLAVDVLQDAGETNYHIEPRLKSIYTKNPIPRVKHKEALQLIANACRCTLYQTRDGVISIRSNYKPTLTPSSNSEASYSVMSNLFLPGKKQEYASFSSDYTRLDNTMYFLPRSGVSGIYTGYISGYQSDSNGEFGINPIVTINQDVENPYYSLSLVFGEALPSGFIIRTYLQNDLVDELAFPNEEYGSIEKEMYIQYKFDDFTKMEIEFTGTEKPYNRIVLNSIYLDKNPDFTMELNDILSFPKATKLERVQEVVVPCYLYRKLNDQESIYNENVTITTANSTMEFFWSEPHCDYSVKINGSASTGVSIVSFGSYYAKIRFSITGTFSLEILGHKYKIAEKKAVKKLLDSGQDGKTITWENPLVSDMTVADNLASWLADHYSKTIEYEYSTRGHPELDVSDIIHQERKTKNGVRLVDVGIYKHVIKFNQAFSGEVGATRQEGS